MIDTEIKIKLADRIWIVMAMLHREMPAREDFSREEIRNKLRETGLMAGLKAQSVAAHLKEHLVANVPPSSTKYRMLYETRPGSLRLYRPGDPVDPGRDSSRPGKHTPKRDETPQEYWPLLDWYDAWIKDAQAPTSPIDWQDDPLIRLIGSGKHIWADEHADEYVERLREEPA